MTAPQPPLAAALACIQEADAALQAKPGSSQAMSLLRFAALTLARLPEEDWKPVVRAVLKNVLAAEDSLLGRPGFSPAVAALRSAVRALREALEGPLGAA